MLYLIPRDARSFASDAELLAYVTDEDDHGLPGSYIAVEVTRILDLDTSPRLVARGGPAPATEAPKDRKPRTVKPPIDAVLQAVEDLYLPGFAASKRVAREKLERFANDEVDGAIDWLTFHGRLALSGKTYRVVAGKAAVAT